MGFEYSDGFMAGETDQWTPYLFRNTTQIFPWLDQPSCNLVSVMTDDAIRYLKDVRTRLSVGSGPGAPSSCLCSKGSALRVPDAEGGLSGDDVGYGAVSIPWLSSSRP